MSFWKRFRAIIVMVVAVSAFTALIAGCGSDSAGSSDQKVLKFGAEMTYPPFEFAEGDKYKGFDIEIGEAIAKEMGMKAEFSSLGFDALIPALKSGQIDAVISGMVITEDREKEIDFSKPYYHIELTLVVKKDDMTIKSLSDIKGQPVGAQIGTTGAMTAEKEGANLTNYDAINTMLQSLESGNIKAVLVDEPVAQYYIQKGNMKDLKLIPIKVDVPSDLGIGVSKNNPELLKKVNEALEKIKENGEYAKIQQKWFGSEAK